MPQMSPMWWHMLMIMFTVLLMLFMMKMYFIKENKIIKKSHKTMNNEMNWKW